MATEALFHLALHRDWRAALDTGEYRVSTRGRTLEQEGFIHASYRHQVQRVYDAAYADAGDTGEAVVLLEIDPRLVGAPVVVEVPDGGTEAFPHVYGPLPTRAVTTERTVTGPDVWDEPDGPTR